MTLRQYWTAASFRPCLDLREISGDVKDAETLMGRAREEVREDG